MKNYFFRLLIIAIATAGILTMPSCTDPCNNVDCGINGVCIEGDCVCDAGYDGTECNIIIRSVFTGLYDVEEICDSDPDYLDLYESSINDSPVGAEFITISNIYNFEAQGVSPDEASVLASVSNIGGEYSLLIEDQIITVANDQGTTDLEVSGTGSYDSATSFVTIEYSITNLDLDPLDSLYIDNCVQAYYPQ